jgi:hypothetical protein
MADNAADSYALAQSSVFHQSVAVLGERVALDVYREQGSDYPWQLRRDIAFQFVMDPETLAQRFVWALAVQPGITAETGETELAQSIEDIWDTVSGAAAYPS